jgi:gliding motility-associated-like protein
MNFTLFCLKSSLGFCLEVFSRLNLASIYQLIKLRIFTRIFIVLLGTFSGIWCAAQDCSQALANQLCSEETPPQDSLSPNPVNLPGCFNLANSYFYSFHTNSTSGQNVQVSLGVVDCDTSLGNDTIYAAVIELAPNGDPCNPGDYNLVGCENDTIDFTFQTNVNPDTDYLLVVASDHAPGFGPCEYTVDLNGDGVDIIGGASPFLITLGEASNLSVTGEDPGSAVQWSDGQFLDDATSDNPTALPEETITFTVSGTVAGCEVTDLVTVTVGPPIFVFNTFTPNDDGINDTWAIKEIERFPNALVNVYDRWGQQIFKSIGYARPWDGTNKGKYLPTAAYYYVIELNSLEVTTPPLVGIVSIVH